MFHWYIQGKWHDSDLGFVHIQKYLRKCQLPLQDPVSWQYNQGVWFNVHNQGASSDAHIAPSQRLQGWKTYLSCQAV